MEQVDPFPKQEPISENEAPPEKKKRAAPKSKGHEPITDEELDKYVEDQYDGTRLSEKRNKAAARKAFEEVLGKEEQAQ